MMKVRGFISSYASSSNGILSTGSPIFGFSSLLSYFKDSSGTSTISSDYSSCSLVFSYSLGSSIAASASSKN